MSLEQIERAVRAAIAEGHLTRANDDCDAYSVKQFCIRHNISRSTFYLLVREGQGPRTIKIGARTLISREAAADWRRSREDAKAQSSNEETANRAQPRR
jgi:predicted DNA-binding transcriptional regulator AlpA